MKLRKGTIYTLTSDGDKYMFGGYTSKGNAMIWGMSGRKEEEILTVQQELSQQEDDKFIIDMPCSGLFWSHPIHDVIDRIKKHGKVLELESEEL